jgi:hypothetical protein
LNTTPLPGSLSLFICDLDCLPEEVNGFRRVMFFAHKIATLNRQVVSEDVVMKILNVGSYNIDHVDRFTSPGETIAASQYQQYAGGKGLNQSPRCRRGDSDTSGCGKGRCEKGGWAAG